MDNTANSLQVQKNADKNYIRILEAKINDLIDQQRKTYTPDLETYDVEQFLSYQVEINKYGELLRKSRERAISQICFNQLMYQNQRQDGRFSSEIKEYVMITINPSPSVLFDEFFKLVKRFMGFSFIEFGVYCFEQRSKTSEWNGFHSHILLKRCKKPSVLLTSIERLFSGIVDNVHDSRKIKIKSQSQLKDVKNYYGYMMGSKADKSKSDSITQTRLWRRALGIDEIYTVGDCSLLVEQSPSSNFRVCRLDDD